MLAAALAALSAAILGAEPSVVDRGRHLFYDASVGRNGVSCAGCHSVVEDEARGDGHLRAGHSLWGVARRPHWRGDSRRTAYPRLESAVDVCVQIFQGGAPLDPQEARALAMFLQEISPGRAQPPLQIQSALEANLDYDRPKYRSGDPGRGRALFYRACHSCHPRGGQGLGLALFKLDVARIALRVREGNGLLRGAREPGAWMPFFGRDRLTDEQVADIAAYVEALRPPETANFSPRG